jgi:hypothetical protein
MSDTEFDVVIAAFVIPDLAKTDTVEATLASAVKKSTAQIDGGGPKQLKAALAQAQAGMGG